MPEPATGAPTDHGVPHATDLVIIGAGPAGLYAAYYAGFRGLSTVIVDSLAEPGGQISALYPEKPIYDVAGFPMVLGKDLVAGCVAQAAAYAPTYLLGHRAEQLVRVDPDDERAGFHLTTHRGTVVRARAVLIAGGIGTFTPRPLPGSTDWEGRGLVHFVRELDTLRGQRVLIVGGGDSAVDWALALEDIAAHVTLIHRRDGFRAHAASVDRLHASAADVRVHHEVRRIEGGERVERVVVFDNRSDEESVLEVDTVIAALGFTADLGPLRSWDVEHDGRRVHVDTRGATSMPGVFAAGDVTEYPGKLPLIATAFGEAATAVNNAAVWLDPGARLMSGHSSDA
jgi:ferredoxin/flavodoxin---NADP+ reductase